MLHPAQRAALDYLRRKGTDAPAETIRAKLATTFSDLDHGLEALDEETARRRPEPGRWSVQEVAEHLIASHRPAVEELASVVAGQTPEGGPIPAHLQGDEPLSAGWLDVRAELAAVHRRLLEVLARADDATSLEVCAPVVMVVRCDGEAVEWVECLDWKAYGMALRAHVLEHARQVERTLAGLAAAS